jgi:hypothetical protein
MLPLQYVSFKISHAEYSIREADSSNCEVSSKISEAASLIGQASSSPDIVCAIGDIQILKIMEKAVSSLRRR